MLKELLHIKKGFSSVEVILGIATFSILVLGLSGSIAFMLQSTEQSSFKNKAVFMADEGLEAARAIRNESFTNLTNGTFGLVIASNKWALSGSSDVNGLFTRTINIATVDSTTKQVTSTVTWTPETGVPSSVSLSMYLTNWLRSVAIGNFTTPSVLGTLDVTNADDGWKIQTAGDYAYFVRKTGSPNFIIANISGATPSLVTSQTLVTGPTNINLSPTGNYGVITSSNDNTELSIFSYSTPSAPNITATYNASGNSDANSAYAPGDGFIYMVRQTGGDKEYTILSASNILVTPTLSGTLDYASNMTDIYVNGNYSYIATANTAQELIVINNTTKTAPAIVGIGNIPVATTGVSITGFGTTILIGTAAGSMYIYDCSNPALPVLKGTFAAGGSVNDIALNSTNTIAFLATSNATKDFIAVNISTLTAPVELGNLNATGIFNGVSYDSTRNRVDAVGAFDTAELTMIGSN